MNPFASIWEDRPQPVKPEPKTPPKAVAPKENHDEARQIYRAYDEKKQRMLAHLDYAKRVAKATDDSIGKTPVRPLATMGCGGGPLLCDHCLKPIILESVPVYNVPADEAWARHPELHDKNWVSYIKGGLIVYIAENGTLRIYHGYSRPTDCDTLDIGRIRAASDAFVSDRSKANIIWKFIEAEFPSYSDKEKNELLSDIMNVMYSYDPGIGVNHP